MKIFILNSPTMKHVVHTKYDHRIMVHDIRRVFPVVTDWRQVAVSMWHTEQSCNDR